MTHPLPGHFARGVGKCFGHGIEYIRRPEVGSLGFEASTENDQATGDKRCRLVVASRARHRTCRICKGFSRWIVDLSRRNVSAAIDPAFGQIWETARSRGIPVFERGAGSPAVAVGDLLIEPLWPLPVAERRSRNDRSLVVRIGVAGHRVLLPGDLEAPAESDLVSSGADLRAEVFALPHHGSRTSSTDTFLQAVGATVAIASAPCRSRFEMPHADVLARAEEGGLSVWWTGRDGAVMVGLGKRVTVWGYGDRMNPDACRSR